jgi:hypothetical protein
MALEKHYHHFGISVADMDGAMRELGTVLGLSWNEPMAVDVGPWPIRVVYSREGPPFVELVEAPEGSPWRAARTGSQETRAFIHHFGYWSSDIVADRRQLERQGLPVELDGADFDKPYFTYHRGRETGVCVELIDTSVRP